MSFVFFEGAAADADIALAVHADNEHIHVVEAALTVVFDDGKLFFVKLFDGSPAVDDVAGGTPHMRARFLDPLMSLVGAPGAGGEENISAAVCERKTHTAVQHFADLKAGLEAIVIFEVVDTPLCKCAGIDEFVFV